MPYPPSGGIHCGSMSAKLSPKIFENVDGIVIDESIIKRQVAQIKAGSQALFPSAAHSALSHQNHSLN